MSKYKLEKTIKVTNEQYKYIEALYELATPKEVEKEFGYYNKICPNCGNMIEKCYQNNCQDCGQTLDWDSE
jgi:predicted amidophosphoribosyltransferase